MNNERSQTVVHLETHRLPLPSLGVKVKVSSQEESERPSPLWPLRSVSKLRVLKVKQGNKYLVIIPSLGGCRIIRVVRIVVVWAVLEVRCIQSLHT